jgi:NADPH:quinone reductase-like Zn-dependent oxidoreductase
MRTWQLNGYSIEKLNIEEKPVPKIINKSDVLIQMKSASLNFRDLIMIDGGYGATGGNIPFVPISDGSGVVIEVGKSVKKFKKGDIITIPFFKDWDSGDIEQSTYLSALGGLEDGVMREYIVYSENKIVKSPNKWSCNEASTLPCAALTAWRTIVTEGKVSDKSKVLVQGLGGVSIFAIQIAKLFNAEVIATTSSDERVGLAKKFGADYVINYNKDKEWWKKVQEITDKKGVDIVVEVGGSKTLEQSIKSSKVGAVIGIIGVLSGGVANLPIGRVIYKASRLIGITCGNQEELVNMVNKFKESNVRPIIDSTFSFKNLPNALKYMKTGKHLGKIVIDFDMVEK